MLPAKIKYLKLIILVFALTVLFLCFLWMQPQQPDDAKTALSANISEVVTTQWSSTTPSTILPNHTGTEMELYPLRMKQTDMRRLIELVLLAGDSRNPNPLMFVNANFLNLNFPYSSPICQKPLAILILIKSASGNYEKRQALRQMWANHTYLSTFKLPIAYAFMLGVGQFISGELPKELTHELQEHNDLIFINYYETYRNNTYKTIGSFRWSLEQCNYEFLLTVDDDMYVSVRNVIRFLQTQVDHRSTGASKAFTRSKFGLALNPNEFLYAGAMYGGLFNPPTRDTGNLKYGISWDDYPFNLFPAYATGGAVIYSRKTVNYIHAAAPFVKHLNIDDVYIGIIATKLGIPTTDLIRVIDCCSYMGTGCPTDVRRPDFNETAVAIHWRWTMEELLQFWNEFH